METKRAADPSPTLLYTQVLRVSLAGILSTMADAVDESAFESLVDVFECYVRTIGSVGSQAAQHAGRTHANLSDALLGLSAVGAGPIAALRDLQRVAPDLGPAGHDALPQFGRGGARRVEGAAAASRGSAEGRPPHVPDYLPPMPDPSAHRATTVRNTRDVDQRGARKLRTKLNRQAQHSLMSIQRDGGAGGLPSSAPAASAGGVFDGASSSGGALVVPDVLVAGQPAVLQSSAAAECAQSALARPAAGDPPDAGASAEATAPVPKRSKHEAVLMLQHLHELEEVMQERG